MDPMLEDLAHATVAARVAAADGVRRGRRLATAGHLARRAADAAPRAPPGPPAGAARPGRRPAGGPGAGPGRVNGPGTTSSYPAVLGPGQVRRSVTWYARR